MLEYVLRIQEIVLREKFLSDIIIGRDIKELWIKGFLKT